MTSPSCFKLILEIDSINYRIGYNTTSTTNSPGGCLSFQQFAQLIEQDHPQIKELNIFDSSKYIIEVYDKDFNDYVKLEENGTIDNLSRLRVIPLSDKIPLNSSLVSSKGYFNETFTTAQSSLTPSLEKVTSNQDTNNDLMVNDGNGVAVSKNDSSASALAVSSTPVASGKSGKIKKKKDKMCKESPIVELSFKRCHDETNEETVTNDGSSRKKIQTAVSKSSSKGNNSEAAAVNVSRKASTFLKNLIENTTFPKTVNLNNGQSINPVDMDNLCKDFKFNFGIDRSPASNPFSPPNSSKTLEGAVKSHKEDKASTLASKKLESRSNLTAKSAQSGKKSKTPNKLTEAMVALLEGRDFSDKDRDQKKKKGKATDQVNIYLKQLSDQPCGLNRDNIHFDLPSTSAAATPTYFLDKNDPSPRNGESDQLLDDEYDSSQELQKPSSSRIIIDDYGRKQLTEEDFILSNLEEKRKFIDIFTPYVRRFSALDRYEDAWEAEEIWNQISLNLKKVNIYTDPKTEFANLLGQYIDIITHLCDWTEQECNQLWPLFLKFHYELTLTPFTENIDNLIKKFESHPKRNPDRNLGGAIQEKTDKRPRHHKRRPRSFNSRHDYSYESKPSNGVLALIGSKPLTADEFAIDNFEQKLLVVETLVEVMATMDKSQMITEAAIWANVSQRLDTLHLHLSPKKCRKHFITLLGQYQSILKNLIEWRPEDCQELWPFFYPFHYAIDFSILQKPFQKAKKKFDEHAKGNFNFSGRRESQNFSGRYDSQNFSGRHESQNFSGRYDSQNFSGRHESQNFSERHEAQHGTCHKRPTSSSFCSDITESDVGEKETKLVDAVFHNLELMDKLSEDYFWQRIAYDMSTWSPPLQDSSRAKWKRLFYNLLHSYENELTHQTRGKFSELFSGHDITPFLKKSETKKEKMVEAQNENASAKMIPKSVLRRFKAPSEATTLPPSSTPTTTSHAAIAGSPGKRKSNVTTAGNYCHADSEIIADQLVLITIFANRLNQTKINREFWDLLNKDLEDAGKVVNPETTLEDYFTKMCRIQLEIMKTSESDIDAVKKWPHFKILNELDLSYFFEDKWTYRRLKSKF